MPRCRSFVLALPFIFASVAHAADTQVCSTVAHHLWSSAAPAMMRDQAAPPDATPLAALVAVAPAAVQRGDVEGAAGLNKPGQSIADALVADHAADPALAAKLRDLPPSRAVRFGETDVWLLDRVDGTLGCHTALAAVVPRVGGAHEVALPADVDPTALCALSAFTAVTIDGSPALWIEQSGAFSNVPDQSTVDISALRDGAFEPPCSVEVDYAITDRAEHAFCDGIDCVGLIRTAEILAMRLRQKETAETLGAGAFGPGQAEDDAAFRRMEAIAAAETQPAELPTFGAAVDTPYTVFADQVVFPLRTDGHIYLARMGHGGFGWRQTPDTLLAVYRLRDEHLVPAASVYVGAARTGISGVAVQ